VVFTGASIARVFFITAATYGAMSPYGSYAPILKELSSGTWAQLSDSLPRSFLRKDEWYDFVRRCGVENILGTRLLDGPSHCINTWAA
jgi:hypothetical protein